MELKFDSGPVFFAVLFVLDLFQLLRNVFAKLAGWCARERAKSILKSGAGQFRQFIRQPINRVGRGGSVLTFEFPLVCRDLLTVQMPGEARQYWFSGRQMHITDRYQCEPDARRSPFATWKRLDEFETRIARKTLHDPSPASWMRSGRALLRQSR